MKISFMVAGVQKAGTTAMYEHLRLHRDVGLPSKKELHFFDSDGVDWDTPDYARLHKLYEPGYPVYGECTPITVYWTSAHKRIRAYNPDMRFILLFRDPVDRAYSHWCMQFARGNEKLSFADAIRTGRQRIDKHPRWFSYVERGYYAAQLRALKKEFPDSPMLFLTSEQLLEETAPTLARLADFIGVSSRGFEDKPILARVKRPVTYPSVVTEADRVYLEGLYGADLNDFSRITNLDIGRWPSVNPTHVS